MTAFWLNSLFAINIHARHILLLHILVNGTAYMSIEEGAIKGTQEEKSRSAFVLRLCSAYVSHVQHVTCKRSHQLAIHKEKTESGGAGVKITGSSREIKRQQRIYVACRESTRRG